MTSNGSSSTIRVLGPIRQADAVAPNSQASSVQVSTSAVVVNTKAATRCGEGAIPCPRALSQMPMRPSPALNHLKKAVQLRLSPGFLITGSIVSPGRGSSTYQHAWARHPQNDSHCDSHPREASPCPLQSRSSAPVSPAPAPMPVPVGSRAATPKVIILSPESLFPPLPRSNMHGLPGNMLQPVSGPVEQSQVASTSAIDAGPALSCPLTKEHSQSQQFTRPGRNSTCTDNSTCGQHTQAQGTSPTRPQSVPVVMQHIQWPGGGGVRTQPPTSFLMPWCMTDPDSSNSSSAPSDQDSQTQDVPMAASKMGGRPATVAGPVAAGPHWLSSLLRSASDTTRPGTSAMTGGRSRGLIPSTSAPLRGSTYASSFDTSSVLNRRCISSLHCTDCNALCDTHHGGYDSEAVSYQASTCGSEQLDHDIDRLESSGHDSPSSSTVLRSSAHNDSLSGPWAVYASRGAAGKAAAGQQDDRLGPDNCAVASDLPHISELSEPEFTSSGQNVRDDGQGNHHVGDEDDSGEDQVLGYFDDGDTPEPDPALGSPRQHASSTTAASTTASSGTDDRKQQAVAGSQAKHVVGGSAAATTAAASSSQMPVGTRCKRHRAFVQGSTQLLQASSGWRRPVLYDPHTGITLRGQQDIRMRMRELEEDFCLGWHTSETSPSAAAAAQSPSSEKDKPAAGTTSTPPVWGAANSQSAPAPAARVVRTASQTQRLQDAGLPPRSTRTAPAPSSVAARHDSLAQPSVQQTACFPDRGDTSSGEASDSGNHVDATCTAHDSSQLDVGSILHHTHHCHSHVATEADTADQRDMSPQQDQRDLRGVTPQQDQRDLRGVTPQQDQTSSVVDGSADHVSSTSVKCAELWSKQESAWQRLRSIHSSTTPGLPGPRQAAGQEASDGGRPTGGRTSPIKATNKPQGATALLHNMSKSMLTPANHAAFLRVVPDLKTRGVLVVGLGHTSALARSSSGPILRSTPVLQRAMSVNDCIREGTPQRSPRKLDY